MPLHPPVRTARTPLDRLLSLFTEVKAGEGTTAVLLAFNIFLIFTAYYIIKPVREALILAVPAGAELKSYAAAGQAVLLLLVAIPLYSALAGRVPRRRLINLVMLFFVANLVLFFLAIKVLGQGGWQLGLGFFLWVGVFNLMVPAQFWSFANDVYTPEQGKRLFAIVAFGASLGAILGSALTDALIVPLGQDQLLLVSAGLLSISLLITNFVESHTGTARDQKTASPPADQEPLARHNAFAMVLGNRYLLLIGVLLLLLNWVNTTGEFILGKTVSANFVAQAAQEGIDPELREAWVGQRIGAFYGNFFFWVNVAGVVIQLFAVSRILKYLGVRVALMILPVIAMGGYALLAFFPVLSVVRWAKTAENATDYSLNNTVRQALFLPTTREEKYVAKQAIDTFFVRAGDVLSALLVFVGLNALGLSTQGFALVNLGLVAVWLLVAFRIGQHHQRLTAKD